VVWGGPAAAALDRLCGLAALGPVVHRAAAEVTHAYAQLRDRMADESLAAGVERDAIVRGMVARLLACSRRVGLSDAQCGALDRVVAFIQREHCNAPTLAALARHAGMSETHLRRLFAARMGMSPHAYITTQRIARAKALLAEGLRTRAVAEACGFADVFYFMRVFRQVTGCTPVAWSQGRQGSAMP
jgi:AraC-like DNA-binding protein